MFKVLINCNNGFACVNLSLKNMISAVCFWFIVMFSCVRLLSLVLLVLAQTMLP